MCVHVKAHRAHVNVCVGGVGGGRESVVGCVLLVVHCHPKNSPRGMRPRVRYLNGSGATPSTRERRVLALSVYKPEVRR